jgi:hypothetical protein
MRFSISKFHPNFPPLLIHPSKFSSTLDTGHRSEGKHNAVLPLEAGDMSDTSSVNSSLNSSVADIVSQSDKSPASSVDASVSSDNEDASQTAGADNTDDSTDVVVVKSAENNNNNRLLNCVSNDSNQKSDSEPTVKPDVCEGAIKASQAARQNQAGVSGLPKEEQLDRTTLQNAFEKLFVASGFMESLAAKRQLGNLLKLSKNFTKILQD